MTSMMCLAASSRVQIPAGSARNFIGLEATVCGVVTEVVDKPYGSFVNMGNHYTSPPHGKTYLIPDFTAVVWSSTRARLQIDPSREFMGKSVCVTGVIRRYVRRRRGGSNDIPQIEITSIDQYTIDGEEND